ncbi:hypothetical protein TorRG33x02_352810 [Trema orientale]|uniref:RNase H type-1 domain-containing protein n=1 Tax=Trema orientale TaxID=63057 RepID=A0A2P5ADT2_TREOI|nr:hypothetical protein TorRG33x02_352810 [Trema orientale]
MLSALDVQLGANRLEHWNSLLPRGNKFNVDAVVRTSFTVSAAIARDETGTIIGMLTEKWNFSDPALGEAAAILTATKLTRMLGARFVVIGSDSSIVINSLVNNDSVIIDGYFIIHLNHVT